MALSIKDNALDAKVRKLAALSGRSLTGAISLAVDNELARRASRHEGEFTEFLSKVGEIQDRVALIPKRTDLSDDDLLGYDENGLPG